MPSFSEPRFAYLFKGREWNILGSSQERVQRANVMLWALALCARAS